MTYEQLDGQVSLFGPDTWSGRMSQEPCPAEPQKEKTSGSSLKKSPTSQMRLPAYLDLRKANGLTQVPLWEMGGALLGEFSMHSFGESPGLVMTECRLNSEHRRGVGESRLSQILEVTAHPRFYLSARACQGILNRADKRGKALPEILRKALEAQATPSRSGGREIDSLGKRAGKGALVQEELSATLGVSQDQTLIQSYGVTVGGSARLGKKPSPEKAPTLQAEASGDNQASVVYSLQGGA